MPNKLAIVTGSGLLLSATFLGLAVVIGGTPRLVLIGAEFECRRGITDLEFDFVVGRGGASCHSVALPPTA